MHAGSRGKDACRTNPIPRDLPRILRLLSNVGAGVLTNELAGGIENLQRRYRGRRRSTEKVVNDRAVRRVLSRRLVGREGRVRVFVPAESPRVGDREEERRRGRRRYTQRLDVVENPEPSSVSRRDQIVAMNCEIANRGWRHVQAQRLPVITIIE